MSSAFSRVLDAADLEAISRYYDGWVPLFHSDDALDEFVESFLYPREFPQWGETFKLGDAANGIRGDFYLFRNTVMNIYTEAHGAVKFMHQLDIGDGTSPRIDFSYIEVSFLILIDMCFPDILADTPAWLHVDNPTDAFRAGHIGALGFRGETFRTLYESDIDTSLMSSFAEGVTPV
jgi:hypothetical protein